MAQVESRGRCRRPADKSAHNSRAATCRRHEETKSRAAPHQPNKL